MRDGGDLDANSRQQLAVGNRESGLWNPIPNHRNSRSISSNDRSAAPTPLRTSARA